MPVLRALPVAVMALAVAAPAADAALGLVVKGSPDPLIAGDKPKLTATVTNLDPLVTETEASVLFNPASQQAAFDSPLLPAVCFEFISVSCALGDLAPGASRSITVPFAPVGSGDMTVDVAAGSAYLRWDVPVQRRADLKLEAYASPDSVVSGGDITLRSTITNASSGIAYGASMRYSLPPEVQVVSRPEDCTVTALTLVCPVGDIGSQRAALAQLTLRSTQQGSFTVLAAVKWARDDPSPDDTTSQLSFFVLPPPEPPESQAPAPAPAPATAPKPRLVSAGTLATGLPPASRCVRTRTLYVVLRAVKNADPVHATVRVTGRRRALVLKGSRAQRPFTLAVPRRGKVTVKLDVTFDNGRRFKATRTFRRC